MTSREEIAYMQARIARMASEKWGVSIAEVGRVFAELHALEHIRDCYGVFHVEGDEAVWEEMQPFFQSRGCPYA